MDAADEQQLVAQAREGNNEAFRILVERHMKHAYNVAYRFVGNHDGAEDIAQEAFMRAHASLRSFRGESEFGTWLYRITTNIALNHATQKRRSEQRMEPMTIAATVASSDHDRTQDLDRRGYIERALHELPTLQRAVVILRHLDGLSSKQVSRILKCSEGTVKTHLFRGLNKLRKKLEFLNENA